MKLLSLLSLLIVVGCGETEKTAPSKTPDAVTVVEVKDAKTLLGKVIFYRDVHGVVDGAVKVVDKKPVYRNWHAEIDIVFSGTPVNLQVLDFSIDCEETEKTASPETPNRVIVVESKEALDHFDWEQTANIVTLFLTFNMRGSQDCVKFNVGLTLNWNTGRKRFQQIPIRPSEKIIQIPDVQRRGGVSPF